MTGLDLGRLDDLDYTFKEEVDPKEEGEGEKSGEGMREQVDSGEEVDGSEEEFPEKATGGVCLEGVDEMGEAADDHGPTEEEGGGDAGDGRDKDGEETGQDQENAQGDGPAEGFGQDDREGTRWGAHDRVSKRYQISMTEPEVLGEDTTEENSGELGWSWMRSGF